MKEYLKNHRGEKMLNKTNILRSKNLKNIIKFDISDKRNLVILLICALGFIMIILSGWGDEATNKSSKKIENNFNVISYEKDLENRLVDIVEKIDGVGKTKIMITLENSIEYIYAKEKKQKRDKIDDYNNNVTLKTQERNDQEEKLMLVDGPNGKKHALIKTELQPKIKGVVIVCQGGDNPVIGQKITNLITTVLDIPTSKVYVTKSL